jgi:hypothetical protein
MSATKTIIDAPSGSNGRQTKLDVPLSAPLLASPTRSAVSQRVGEKSFHRRLHVLRDPRQEATLVPSNRVPGHPKCLCQLLLSEAELGALTTQLPTGQAATGYLREHELVHSPAPATCGIARSGAVCRGSRAALDLPRRSPVASLGRRESDRQRNQITIGIDLYETSNCAAKR